MSSELGVGDWVAVTRGRDTGMQGEITEEIEPLDGGPTCFVVTTDCGEEMYVAADRLQRTRKMGT